MQCFLLCLAFGLVMSDKLDRTYLPPPGAKHSGGSNEDLQTPLEYPKETYPASTPYDVYPGALQELTELPSYRGIDKAMSKFVPTSTYKNDFIQTKLFPDRGYGSILQKISPEEARYEIETKIPPNNDYLTGQKTDIFQQSYITPTSSPGFTDTPSLQNLKPTSDNGQASGYYYELPEDMAHKNNATNKIINTSGSRKFSDAGLTLDYNPLNNRHISLLPRTSTTENISQNYEPSVFGFYGGNPMIMTSQYYLPEVFQNMNITKTFGEYGNNIPGMSINQDEQNFNEVVVAHPFQTPLVGKNTQSYHKHNVTRISSSSSNSNQLQTTESSLLRDNVPQVEQRMNILTNPKLKFQSPQAEADRYTMILNNDNAITSGDYSYSFDTSNGIHADENGTAIDGVKATGSYSYTGDDGKIYRVTYTADENGFQPKGDHLPTPPPIPEAIQKVIEQAVNNKIAGIIDDGSYDEKKYGHMNYEVATSRYRNFIKDGVDNVVQKTKIELPRSKSSQRTPTVNTFINNVFPITNYKQTDGIQLVNRRTEIPSRDTDYLKNKSPLKNNDEFLLKNANNIPMQNIDSNNTSTTNEKPSYQSYKQTITKSNSNDPIKENNQVEYQNKILNSSNRTDNRNENTNLNSDKFYQNLNLQLPEYYNQGQLNQVVQSGNDSKAVPYSKYKITSDDNGYYYVPPIIKFEVEEKPLYQNPEPISYKNIAYVTNDNTTETDDNFSVTNRASPINAGNHEAYENGINADLKRKSYSGKPEKQVRDYYYDDTQMLYPNPDEIYKHNRTAYTNDLDSTPYVFTTTPMLSQSTQQVYELMDGYPNQYYQTTIVPEGYEQTITQEEKKLNIPYRPKISVSQEFVTSTIKPGFGDGINLKVNQNVNIYGLDRPTSAPNTYKEFSDNVSTYYDGFYTTVSPEEKNRLIGTTYTDFGRPIQFSTNNFENSELALVPRLDASIFSTETQFSTGKVIGEDFSGPKQPPVFNSETGYHYK